MAVPGEQESFKSQSFSAPKRAPVVSSGPPDAGKRLAAERQQTREKYFDNRQDVSSNRLDRRLLQAQGVASFKEQFTKPVNIIDPVTGEVTGTVTGLTQATADAPRSLTEEKIRLANKYGPTMGEIAGDISYRAGKTLGALGEAALSGKVGFLGAIKEVANYALDKANKGYDKLNPVQQEIFDNPNKYPFASNISSIDAVNSSKNLALEAQRDVLGLGALEASAADATNTSAVGGAGLSSFVNEPIGTFGGGTMGPRVPVRDIEIERLTTPVSQTEIFPAEEIKKSALDRFSPEYLEQQKALLDELNLSPQVEELLKANQPGGKAQREVGLLDVINPFDGVPTGMALGEYISPEMYDIQKFKDTLPEGSTIPEMVDTVVGGDDQASVTDYNNPGNLTDVGQSGATGETYGNNFAVFPNAQAGITALENDLALKVGRSNKVEDIIGQYASGDPNVGNYIDFVTSKVGPTVDQNELNDLRDAVIRFENKPDIAQQYLAMVADGGMIDKELTNLQNGLQNMYNGIPSVRRR